MKRTLYLVVVLLLWLPNLLYSQNKPFSTSHTAFITELDSFFRTTQQSENIKFIETFTASWQQFSTERKNLVITTINSFQRRKAPVNTNYVNYLQSVMLFDSQKHDLGSYKVWEDFINQANGKLNYTFARINEFLEFTIQLLKQNAIYSSKAITWRTSSANYRFVADKPIKIIYTSAVDLWCIPKDKSDSLAIYETQGYCIPLDNKWYGNTGTVYWTRVGYARKVISAKLKKYVVATNRMEYSADSVSLYSSVFQITPSVLTGKLIDKITSVKDSTKSKFPSFEANEEVFIKNIIKNIDYKGPITLKGIEFYGSNKDRHKAAVMVYNGTELKLTALSRNFIFTDTSMIGYNTEIKIPLSKDKQTILGSITHPGLTFYYRNYSGYDTARNKYIPGRMIELIRPNEGLGQSVFHDSYHKIDIDVEAIRWNLDSTTMKFLLLPGVRRNVDANGNAFAIYQSQDYFDAAKYRKLQSLDKENPLVVLKRFSDKTRKMTFTVKELLPEFVNVSISYVRQKLMELSFDGFVDYDVEFQEGLINQKLLDFMKVVGIGEKIENQKDYDILQIKSQSKIDTISKLGESAFDGASSSFESSVLNLKNLQLRIFGIEEVPLSKIQKVRCLPDKNNSITMNENRNFKYDGTLQTTYFDYIGKNFSYIYNDFKFIMDSIRFMKLFIPGQVKADTIKNDTINNRIEEDQYGFVIRSGKSDNMKIFQKNFNYGDVIAFYDTLRHIEKIIVKYAVQTRLENITGEMKIDSATNKSGRKVYPRYPIFTCKKPAKVFYDQYYRDEFNYVKARYEDVVVPILNKVYDRKKFYFEVNPFVIKHISDFKPEKWQLPGTLVSGIFPDLKENLVVRCDSVKDLVMLNDTVHYSLGISRPLPVKAEVLYANAGKGGAGTADVSILLTNQGLRGNGTINYLTSQATSKRIMFFPNSTIIDADTFSINGIGKDSLYADSHSKAAFITWQPYQKQMLAFFNKSKDDIYKTDSTEQSWKLMTFDIPDGDSVPRLPAEMYKNAGTVSGIVKITPTAHTGEGTMYFSNAELSSNVFHYKAKTYSAATSNFIIRRGSELAFEARNYKAEVNYSKLLGVFTSNTATAQDTSYGIFVPNKYKAYMNMFQWYTNRNEIEIGSSKNQRKGNQRVGSLYVSTDEGQQRLSWTSYSTGYNFTNFELRAYEVDTIIIGNSIIYPDDTLIVDKTGYLRPLADARIVTDLKTKRYNMYKANVDFVSKKIFKGNAFYDYKFPMIDPTTGKKDTLKQQIYFENFSSDDNNGIAEGDATIKDATFKLSPHFVDFGGDVLLNSKDSLILFNGTVKTEGYCGGVLNEQRFNFNSKLYPADIRIPIDKTLSDESGIPLQYGFYSSIDSPYVSFFTPVLDETATQMLPIPEDSRYIFYNEKANKYIIQSMSASDIAKNEIAYDTKKCIISGEGDINLGVDLGNIDIKNVGTVARDIKTGNLDFNLLLGVNFFFNDDLFKQMAKTIITDKNLFPCDLKRADYQTALSHILDKKKLADMKNDIENYGTYRNFPEKLRYSLLFNHIQMKWNNTTHSFLSAGKLGMSLINGEQINKYVDGFIEIMKRGTGDEITVYLEINPQTWYYFNYSSSIMSVLSSNKDFNEKVRTMKESDRKQRSKKEKQQEYSFQIADDAARSNFLQRITGIAPSETPDNQEDNSDPSNP